MNILQVIPKFSVGGAETMCVNLCLELKRKGNNIFVASLYNEKTFLTSSLEEAGITVFYLNKKRGIDFSINKKIRKIVMENSISVIHSHLYSTKYAHLFMPKGLFHFHTIHNVAFKDAVGVDRLINRFLFRRGKVTPVALSKEIQKTVCDCYNLPLSSVPVVFNGIPLEKCLIKYDYSPCNRVIHVGRMSEAKNHRIMIESMKIVHSLKPNMELSFYGDGPLLDDVIKQIEDSGATSYIHVCGTINDIYSALSKSDIFILPSLWEGMPMTIIEALGTGLPIIASNVGGIPDMLTNDYDSILIKPSANILADSILRISSDVKLRKKLGGNALKTSTLFSSKKMASDYLKLYEK